MLEVLVPAAALLTHNSAVKTEVKTSLIANAPIAQATDSTMPTTASDNPIADGHTYP